MVDGWTGSKSGEDFCCLMARRRSSDAARMRLSRDAVGILKLCGNHFTVSQMREELVEGIHILWQR